MGAFLLWLVAAALVCSARALLPGWRTNVALSGRSRQQKQRSSRSLSDSDSKPSQAEEDTSLKNFIQGTTPWKGNRGILKRKFQVPSQEYAPQQVVLKVLDALQVCDDPQLDHGSCVLLEFRSPQGPLSQGKLDPAEYGRFLRNTEYGYVTCIYTYNHRHNYTPYTD
jgi:hypothetical protein